MIEGLLATLAFGVFGVFWLSSQPWFDVLPRGMTRRIGYIGLAILLVALYAAPHAFQAGLTRFAEHAAAKAQRTYESFMGDVLDRLVPADLGASPSPTPVPNPRPTQGRPQPPVGLPLQTNH